MRMRTVKSLSLAVMLAAVTYPSLAALTLHH